MVMIDGVKVSQWEDILGLEEYYEDDFDYYSLNRKQKREYCKKHKLNYKTYRPVKIKSTATMN